MTAPLVSIGIPTVTRLGYLKEAVESALAQTWRNVEVLVGDDGDTLDIQEWSLARSRDDPRLTYWRNSRRLGLAGNWNAIVEKASGDFVVLLGDDDRLLPQFVERLLAATESDTAVIFCNHHIIDANGCRLERETERVTRRYHRAELVAGRLVTPAASAWQMVICPSAALIRRRDVLRVGFRPELNTPDIEFFIRLAGEHARFDFVPEFLAEYRVHGSSETSSGLRTDALAAQLLGIAVPAEIEPLKRELMRHLLVNATSRCLEHGEWQRALEFLKSDYYPASSRRASYMMQRVCATLRRPFGTALYRTILQAKHAVTH